MSFTLAFAVSVGLYVTAQGSIPNFKTLYACEQAAAQTAVLYHRPQVYRTVCLNLEAREIHWRGHTIEAGIGRIGK